jgi:hypothetical protein
MAFEVYANSKTTKSETSTVDYEALNKYVVETADLQERAVLNGYISAIVDLGEQNQMDAEVEFKGTAEDEAAEIEKNPNTYFKDGLNDKNQPVRLKCWPQKPCQCVAVAVDFPDIILDKGQFFGESNPQPMRLWMGGQFYMGKDIGMQIAKPTPLRVTKKDGHWSFAQNHQFYKMAVDSKLIKPGEAFLPKDIDKLLGKSFQFQAQVFFKETKGKSYFTEWIKYQGPLGRGQKECEIIREPILIQFNQDNKPEDLKELRYHIINTMKNSPSFPGSKIESQLEALYEQKPQEGTQEAPEAPKKEEPVPTPSKPAAKPGKPAPKPVTNFDDLDDDIPF